VCSISVNRGSKRLASGTGHGAKKGLLNINPTLVIRHAAHIVSVYYQQHIGTDAIKIKFVFETRCLHQSIKNFVWPITE